MGALRRVKVVRVGRNENLCKGSTRELSTMAIFHDLITICKSFLNCDLTIELISRHHVGQAVIPMFGMKHDYNLRAVQNRLIRWGNNEVIVTSGSVQLENFSHHHVSKDSSCHHHGSKDSSCQLGNRSPLRIVTVHWTL